MTKASEVVQLAKTFIGKVVTGNNAHKVIVDTYNGVLPRPRGYAVNYQDDWCDVFVTYLAIKTGAVDIIGRECGVQRHIDIFKEKGIWIEDGRITPKPGDIITFNWDDWTQANDGWADHIGIVEKVENGQIYTIEGNTDRQALRRTYQIGNGFIRGFARPKYGKAVVDKPVTPPTVSKPKPKPPVTNPLPKPKIPVGFTPEKAKFTVTVNAGIQERTGAHGLRATKGRVLPKGRAIFYDSWASKDGYIWVHYIGNDGHDKFLPVREVNKPAWGTFE